MFSCWGGLDMLATFELLDHASYLSLDMKPLLCLPLGKVQPFNIPTQVLKRHKTLMKF